MFSRSRSQPLPAPASGAVVLALAALVAVTACGVRPDLAAETRVTPAPSLSPRDETAPRSAPADAAAPAASSVPPSGSTTLAPGSARYAVAVRDAGFVRPFENDAQVLTSGPFALRVHFSPYPPADRTDLEVTVVDAETSRPVEGAQVSVRADMPGHGHGVTAVRLADRGEGRHGTSINLLMGGDWIVDLDVRRGSARGTLGMLISSPTGG